MKAPVRAYLALGSNLGDRMGNLAAAVRAIAAAAPPPAAGGVPAIAVEAVSPVYETAALGPSGEMAAQPDFLNAVVAVATTLDPLALLRLTAGIEAALGRVRVERWGPRTVDIDLLLVGSERIDTPELQLPHPRIGERTFVLRPLLDLDPSLALPLGGTVTSRLAALEGPPCRMYAPAAQLRSLAGLEPARG